MGVGRGGRVEAVLSRSLGGTLEKVLPVLFVSFSASNSVLRLMRCYCFSLSPSVSLSLSYVCVCVACEANPTKVKQSIKICWRCRQHCVAIAQLLQLFSLVSSHFVHLCSIYLPFPPPLYPLTHLHVSFRWKITPFKNLLYVLPDFSFILFHVPLSFLRVRVSSFSFTLCFVLLV